MKDINLFRCTDSIYFREISNKSEALEDLDCDGFLIRGSEKVARSIIASLRDHEKSKTRNEKLGKNFLIGIYGGDDAFNRRVVESLKFDYLVSVETNSKLDNLKQRDSGLNHVVARMAADKEICIVVDMGKISRLEGREKGKMIAKIMQNIKICRKVGCRIKIASLGKKKKDIFDLKGRQSFGVSVGISSNEIKDSVKF